MEQSRKKDVATKSNILTWNSLKGRMPQQNLQY